MRNISVCPVKAKPERMLRARIWRSGGATTAPGRVGRDVSSTAQPDAFDCGCRICGIGGAARTEPRGKRAGRQRGVYIPLSPRCRLGFLERLSRRYSWQPALRSANSKKSREDRARRAFSRRRRVRSGPIPAGFAHGSRPMRGRSVMTVDMSYLFAQLPQDLLHGRFGCHRLRHFRAANSISAALSSEKPVCGEQI